MGFSVPVTTPPPPAYGLPPNVIRASYALNLIQTDAFQFATSRRKVANLFNIDPLPGGGVETIVARFAYYPLPTANGDLLFAFVGANVDLKVKSLTAGLNVVVTAGAFDLYTGTLSGLTAATQQLEVLVTDRGAGSLAALFLFEASLTAGQLP